MGSAQENMPEGNGPSIDSVIKRYTQEAAKRLGFRPEGTAQFVELEHAQSDRLRSLAEDPWVDYGAFNSHDPPLKDGSQCKFLVLGAGFGGLLYTIRLIQAGFSKDDIRLVDSAGGFGGTWYWNRYPGLHCDVESYIYLPLLEETGYVPKNKYASGPEILEHVHRIVDQWQLRDKALFCTDVEKIEWNEGKRLWMTKMVQRRGPGRQPVSLQVQSQYVFLASGVLTKPQVPKIPCLESFEGDMFHTARWDYSVTGGSPTNLSMPKLSNKRVGIIGTGATAIQIVPQLARSAKQVYVFQRTPSAVNWRGQRPTEMKEWHMRIAAKKGWQTERMANFSAFTSQGYGPSPTQENMVADAWTAIPSLAAILGGPMPEKIAEHVAKLQVLDLAHAEEVRGRVDEIVKDPKVAKKLKAWYPSWCKRPTYSDEYLQVFNLPNVVLVDTDGRGVDSASKAGLTFNGEEYPLDVLVLSTGYITPGIGNGSPAARTGVEIQGRNGLSLDHKWQNHGAATLHGIMSHDFPNLFFMGPPQAGNSSNFMEVLVHSTSHAAYIIAEAEKRLDHTNSDMGEEAERRKLVEVTAEGEESWTMEVLKRAAVYAAVPSCTPGYITSEGERSKEMTMATPQDMMKLSRAAGWGEGIASYLKTLRSWRQEGSLNGLQISI